MGVVLAATLRWFDNNPWTLDTAPIEVEVVGAAPASRRATGDVLLVVDAEAIASSAASRSHAALDLSYGWMNLLEAEFGPYDIVDVGDLPTLDMRAVVVSASALARIDGAMLGEFVTAGGVVLLDAPTRDATFPDEHLTLSGVRDGGRRLSFPVDLVPPGLDPSDVADWLGTPVPRPPVARHLLPSDVRTIDLGHGLFFERRVGRGKVVCAGVNVARWLTTMLQGVPTNDDFTLEERHGDYEGILEPDDLVADPRLRTNEIPFADLLMRSVARLLDPPDAPPLPRVLWFPAASQGVVLMTHDEDFQGGAATAEMHAWDERLGVKGTSFVIPHPRMEEDWTGEQYLLSLGLHWNRYPMPHGIGPIEPVAWVESAHEQMSRLEWARLFPTSGFSAETNRNHYLILGPTWTSTFRALAGAGIRLDSTFGANKGRGHLFGTARPYSILDENGFPLPIRELPFINQEDWGGADAAYFTRMFETNAARHKGALVLLFHPHLIVRTADGAALFEHAAKEALRTGHRPMTMEELDWDLRKRIRAKVRSKAYGSRLTVTIHLERPTGLAFPESRARVSSILCSSQPVDIIRRTIGGVSHAIVAMESGDFDLIVDFESD